MCCPLFNLHIPTVYTNIFYFIIVFSLFSIYDPPEKPGHTVIELVGNFISSCGLFFVFCKLLFNRFSKRYYAGTQRERIFATQHGKLITGCSVAAIGLYSILLFIFDIKFYLLQLPLFSISNFLLHTTGIAVFMALLSIIWICAYPSYRQFYDSDTTVKTYLISQLRLNIAIITPMLIFSVFLDLIHILPQGLVATIQSNEYLTYVLCSIFFVILAIVFPWLLVTIWNCKPLPPGMIREKLEAFCQKAGFSCTNMLFWNLFAGKLISAGIVGCIKKIRYILISPTMLEMLNYDELESVVAHEIGHVKCRHMIFYIFFIIGYMLFAYVFFNIIYFGILSQDFFLDMFLEADGSIKQIFYMIPVLVLLFFLLIYFRFVFGFFSRNFERQSDLYAIKIQGHADHIISSLEKIASCGTHSKTAPNWHHYSIQQRIDFLTHCDNDRRLIKKHDRKVAKSVLVFFIILLITGYSSYGLDRSLLNTSELHVIQRVLEKKVENNPGNATLHFILANVYYEKKLFLQAEKEYHITIAINPADPEALNNLAWLYATCEDHTLRNPQKALSLSIKAARIDPKPHILDTLAESYFINGYYEEAVETSKKALAKNPDDKTYFTRQLEKFEKKLHKEKLKKKIFSEGAYISI